MASEAKQKDPCPLCGMTEHPSRIEHVAGVALRITECPKLSKKKAPCGEGHICCDDPRQFPEHERPHQHPDFCDGCREAKKKAPSIFGLPASCPACGGPLELINSSANGSLSVGIFRCEPCTREFEVTVRIALHHKDRWKPREQEVD